VELIIDNITAPVATCLGDLLTLFILALLGSLLVGTMDTPIPLIAVILMGLAGVWFTRAVMRDEWVKNVAKGGWAPLVCRLILLTSMSWRTETDDRSARCSFRVVLGWH
jgi:solute carrier family 41